MAHEAARLRFLRGFWRGDLNVALPPLHHLDLFSGAGMFGIALRILCDERIRTVAYVEREAYAAADLVARMEDKALDQAPVWDDAATFDGRAWRGRVDIVSAGFPCQDISVAGQRRGIGAETRSGLFFHVPRIASECEASVIIMENVFGIFSNLSDVPEGQERTASIVARTLAEAGYDSRWISLRASAVGATHERERWICLAYRDNADGRAGIARLQSAAGEWRREPDGRGAGFLADAERSEWGEKRGSCGDGGADGLRREREEGAGWTGATGENLADAGRQSEHAEQPEPERRRHRSAVACEDGEDMAQPNGIGRREEPGRHEETSRPDARGEESGDTANAADMRWRAIERGEQDGVGRAIREGGRPEPRELADACEPGLQGGERQAEPPGSTLELYRTFGIFAPGPEDPSWERIAAEFPNLEPAVCRMADGMAAAMAYRTDALRLLGNGIVPLQCAAAIAILLDDQFWR